MAIKIINGKAVYVSENTKEPSSNVPKTPSYNTQPSTGSSIKIVNGKAVVVPNGQEPKNAPQTIQTKQTPKNDWFNIQKDPGLILRSIKDLGVGLVPGLSPMLQKFQTATDTTVSPRERMIAASDLTNIPKNIGEWGIDFAKWRAGVIPRMGLGISDLLGGPSKANIPVLGPQQSPQQTYRDLQQTGAGKITSAAISATQMLMDLLIGKHIAGGIRSGLRRPTTPIQEAPTIPQPPPKPQPLLSQRVLIPEAPKNYPPIREVTTVSPNNIPILKDSKSILNDLVGENTKLQQLIQNYDVASKMVPNLMDKKSLSKLLVESNRDIKVLENQIAGMYETAIPNPVMDPRFATERPTAQVGKTVVSNIPSGKLQPGESPESFMARIQAQNKKFANMESPITKGGEWKAGQKEAFDHALSVKDATTVKNMLPDIPKEYKDRFSGQIKDTMKVDSILEQLVKPDLLKEKGALQKAKDTLASLNPYRFETGKLESRGPVGKEIVTRGRRANAQAIVTAGEFKKINESSGIAKLTEQQLLNFRDVMQNKAQPIDPTVMKIVQVYKPLFEKYGQATGVQMMENYYPRRLSPEFKKLLDVPQNREQIIQKIMTEGGVDRAKAVEMLDNGKRKGSFEFERTIKDLPDYLEVNGKKIPTRVDPLKEMYAWQNEVARRLGIIKEFGAKDEIAKSLISELGKGNKFESKWKQEAQDYVDRVAGRKYEVSELDPVYDFLKGTMVISKLNPLTTVSNELQGHINSWLQYGAKGLTDATFGKQGNEFIKTLGLDTLKGKIGDEVASNSWATKYMKAIGMEGSEVRGFGRTAQSTFGAINRAFSALKKNPSDAIAYKLLKDHGMFVDDTVLAKALADGKIPDMELKMGLVEGVRQKMFFATPGERPTWANTGAGGTLYMFKNYVMNQMQLLAKAPPERQLAYIMVVAPLMGLPVMTLRRMIQGRDMPENPADTFVQAASSGPGTPFDIYQSVSNKDFLTNFLLGGFSPLADITTSSNKLKSLIGAFGPASTLYKNRLFPPKK